MNRKEMLERAKKRREGITFTYNKVADTFKIEAKELRNNLNLDYIENLLFVIEHRDYWAGLSLKGIKLRLYKIKSYIQLKVLHLLRYGLGLK